VSITVDGQGLAEVDYVTWRTLNSPEWFTYRGGINGARFIAYRVGAEVEGGVSELPPPSLKSLAVVCMYAERDGYICHLCGEPVSMRITDPLYTRRRASPDHVTPRVLGGSDYPSNIRTSHLSCNKARAHRPLTEQRGTDSRRKP
jgi:hypothetical protein